MNVASLKNCKALFELSEWDQTSYRWFNEDGVITAHPINPQSFAIPLGPAYDSGYLLRKLGSNIASLSIKTEQRGNVGDGFMPHLVYGTWNGNAIFTDADTPEDALAKLAIELFKQGILQSTKENK